MFYLRQKNKSLLGSRCCLTFTTYSVNVLWHADKREPGGNVSGDGVNGEEGQSGRRTDDAVADLSVGGVGIIAVHCSHLQQGAQYRGTLADSHIVVDGGYKCGLSSVADNINGDRGSSCSTRASLICSSGTKL